MSAIRLVAVVVLVATLGGLASCKLSSNSSGGSDSNDLPDDSRTPNILLVIMDDVGIDQLTNMGYGGVEAPSLPGLDQSRQIAQREKRHHNNNYSEGRRYC